MRAADDFRRETTRRDWTDSFVELANEDDRELMNFV